MQAKVVGLWEPDPDSNGVWHHGGNMEIGWDNDDACWVMSTSFIVCIL
jgi:hypothetical protein